ncbi:MAG: ChbG/HpnK family deacetylase [Hyphomicrobiaceae bacterium]
MTGHVDTAPSGSRRAAGSDGPGPHPILCADDFGISDGVSRGIEELAAAGRLSATSAIVTLPGWQSQAARLARLRPRVAIGLHINLTLGRPLGPMPELAPDGTLPSIGRLTLQSLRGRIDSDEIAAEVGRQLASFVRWAGAEPDFVDGHQHAHALPGVRAGVVKALVDHFPGPARPLVRVPADRAVAIVQRGTAIGKCLVLDLLGTGFRDLVRHAGFPANDSFSGVSSFNTRQPYAIEFKRFLRAPGGRHLIMCHPGYPDAELAGLDPITERRRQELDTLMTWPGLPSMIWHPDRSDAAGGPRWPEAG